MKKNIASFGGFFGVFFYFSSVYGETVPGVVPGNLSMHQGGASYTLPLTAPAGRNGIQPKLALNYFDSKKNGPVGIGWNIRGASSIYRCGATWGHDRFVGGVTFTDKDRFCMDGKRLIQIQNSDGQGVAEFKKEIDNYSQIKAHGGTSHNPSYFVVKTKAGRTMTFGGSSSSQTISGKGAVTWALRTVNDITNNNPIHYHYWFNDNHQYLSRIEYDQYQYDFTYNERADKRKYYTHGKWHQLSKRLSKVRIAYRGQSIKEYRLAYQLLGDAKQSYLHTVHQCDGDGSHCFKPIIFDWQQDHSTHYPHGRYDKANEFAPQYRIMTDSLGELGSRFIDVNGDGLLDQVYHRWIASGQVEKGAWINTGSGWREDNHYAPAYHIVAPHLHDKPVRGDLGSRFIDVNGDGLVDQVFYRQLSATQVQKGAYINTGVGWHKAYEYSPRYPITQDDKGEMGSRFIDINGDVLVDQLYHRYIEKDKSEVGAFINTGMGWESLPDYKPPYNIVIESTRKARSNGSAGTQWVDVNGDGLVDHLFHREKHKGAFINRSQRFQLHGVTDSLGNATTIRYKALTDPSIYTKGSGANWPIIDVQYSLPVVSEVVTDNGVGGKSIVRSQYKGLKVHTRGRAIQGFKQITEIHVESGKKKIK